MRQYHGAKFTQLGVMAYSPLAIEYSLLAESPRLLGVIMAFDESLADRIRQILRRKKGVEEKKMFGCICFFLNGNAVAGVWKDRLIVRLGPDEGEAALREPHVLAFDITGKPMRNWVAVESPGVNEEAQVKTWIDSAVKFVRTLPPK